MKHFFLSLLLFFASFCFAGTGVGNFSYISEKEFDFRIGYDSQNWSLEGREEQRVSQKMWTISNSKKVTDSQNVSLLNISFIDSIQVKNDNELLQEIKKLHPEYQWKKLTNPDFSIGYVSNQIWLNQQRTRSFEYYFSRENVVIQIEVYRDKTMNGSTDIDLILSTIRRPSSSVSLESIQPAATNAVQVGETACYQIKVDQVGHQFQDESVSRFEVKGVLPHWSFKAITWNKEKSLFDVCFKISSRFDQDGLLIQELFISPIEGSNLTCTHDSTDNKGNASMKCRSSNSNDVQKINYLYQKVVNNKPTVTAPVIQSIQIGSQSNSLRLRTTSSAPLAVGKVVIDGNYITRGNTFLIYPDQMPGNEFEFVLDKKRLPSGFSKIQSISLTDQVGNSVELRSTGASEFYSQLATDSQTQTLTNVRVISVSGGQK